MTRRLPEHFEPTFRRGTRENTFSPLSYSEHPSLDPCAMKAACSRKAPIMPPEYGGGNSEITTTTATSIPSASSSIPSASSSPPSSQQRRQRLLASKDKHRFQPPPTSAPPPPALPAHENAIQQNSTSSSSRVMMRAGEVSGRSVVSPNYRSIVGSLLTDSTNLPGGQKGGSQRPTVVEEGNRSCSIYSKVDHNKESHRPTVEEELKPKRSVFQPHLNLSMIQPQPLGSRRGGPSSARGSSDQIAFVLGTPRGGANRAGEVSDLQRSATTRSSSSSCSTSTTARTPPAMVYQDPMMTIPSFNTAQLHRGGRRIHHDADDKYSSPGEKHKEPLFAGCAYGKDSAVLHDVDCLGGRSARKMAPHQESAQRRLRRMVSEHVAQRKGGLASLWVAITRGAVGTVRAYDQQSDRTDCGVSLVALQQQLSTMIGDEVQFLTLRTVLDECCSTLPSSSSSSKVEYIVKFREFADAFSEVPSY